VNTDYYSSSKKMGAINEKDGGYWDSNVELTARAFAVYVLDRLPNRSDYLAGHAESAVGITFDKDGEMDVVRAFPQGEERKAINAVFDELIAELKLQQFLTHEEHILPEPEQPEKPETLSAEPIPMQPQALAEPEKPPQLTAKESAKPLETTQGGFFNAENGQLSLFDIVPRNEGGAKKPSILGGLSAALAKVAEADAGKAPGKVKNREPESV
jgi:hypothetical protein